jgi:hypothetical protein
MGRLTELTDDPIVFYTTVLDLFQPSHDEALDGFMTAEPTHYATLKAYLHRICYLTTAWRSWDPRSRAWLTRYRTTPFTICSRVW